MVIAPIWKVGSRLGLLVRFLLFPFFYIPINQYLPKNKYICTLFSQKYPKKYPNNRVFITICFIYKFFLFFDNKKKVLNEFQE